MEDVRQKKVTILGAARSGLAAARLLNNSGADVFVSDNAAGGKMAAAAGKLREYAIPHEFGGHSRRAFNADFVVLSPGIPVRSDVVQSFMEKGKPVYSEIEVASWFCKASIIAVTGSNGKTTTTTLIGEMLRKQNPEAIVAGNIGQPLSEFVGSSRAGDWAVVEVSSFQLETIRHFHPRQAVVLNFAPNHLDRYDSYEDYLSAKWQITTNLNAEDYFIYNGCDKGLAEWSQNIIARREGFFIDGQKEQPAAYKDGIIYLRGDKLIETVDMKLRGKHNYMNAMAAALAADNAGVHRKQITEVLQTFKGVEHRLEFVAKMDGIKFINDSKATTVESLAVALQSFSDPVILIAGGKDKGSDFSKLNELIHRHVKAIVLIGKAAEKMADTWQGLKPLYHDRTLDEAVKRAHRLAAKDEVVLLSPACASFDMFNDFEDRGRQFKDLVHKLQDENETQ